MSFFSDILFWVLKSEKRCAIISYEFNNISLLIYSWKKNNWVKSNKSKAKNIDLWERMLELISYHNVRFIKVKGHADNKYNNRCDVLAVEAREKLV